MPRGICLFGATGVKVKDSNFQINDKRSFEGSDIQMKGIDLLFELPEIKELARLFSCVETLCEFTNETLHIENTSFNGNIQTHASAVHCTNANLILENCTFEMENISKVGGYIHYSIDYKIQFVKVTNVTLDAWKISSETSIMDFLAGTVQFQNFRIMCAPTLGVVHTLEDFVHHYACKNKCQHDAYPFQAGSMTLGGNSVCKCRINMTVKSTNPKCFPCPMGANCDSKFKALPNYWGYRDQNDFVTMLRCPEGYCCEGNETCTEIDSCNTRRVETLCGTCKENFTESLFSTNCLPIENCYETLVMILYVVCVVGYAVVLLTASSIKNFILAMFKVVHVAFKNCTRSKDTSMEEAELVEITLDTSFEDETCGNFNNKMARIRCSPQKSRENKRSVEKSTDTDDLHNVTREDPESGMKHIQILFYYVQDTSLFQVVLPHEDNQSESIFIKIHDSPPIRTLYTKLSKHRVTIPCKRSFDFT